ncbi:MAG: SDR family oxidoreductase [Chloroflexi bacterium]|nr:SDR family oxidoreductase [Chloroflexota bacterium]
MRIAMTGPTSLLGRNVLFELFTHYRGQLEQLELLLLGRDKPDTPLRERVKEMFAAMTPDYFSETQIAEIYGYLDQRARYIDIDLQQDKLGISEDDFQSLAAARIDFFFHIAALTDFRDLPIVVETLKRTNVEGTRRVLDLVTALRVGEFDYVSSAYTCGVSTGEIQPDYVNIHQSFRNPYEHSKLQAEIRVRLFKLRTGTRCRFFRPSTICGRLNAPPLGATNKFDVFYAIGAFFLGVKLQMYPWEERYNRALHLSFRALYSLESGLNIVPVDFVAKAMLCIAMSGDPGENYHLVNEQETPHALYVPLILDTLRVEGVTRVDQMPQQLNEIEALYYAKVGKLYTPYVTSAPILFNTDTARALLDAVNVSCPLISRENFGLLMDYARQHDFGAGYLAALGQ